MAPAFVYATGKRPKTFYGRPNDLNSKKRPRVELIQAL